MRCELVSLCGVLGWWRQPSAWRHDGHKARQGRPANARPEGSQLYRVGAEPALGCRHHLVPAAGFFCLAVVLDRWSRKIVAWSMANHLRAGLVLDATEAAVAYVVPRTLFTFQSEKDWEGREHGIGDGRLSTGGLEAGTRLLLAFAPNVGTDGCGSDPQRGRRRG
jgi:transposase InsO family protein